MKKIQKYLLSSLVFFFVIFLSFPVMAQLTEEREFRKIDRLSKSAAEKEEDKKRYKFKSSIDLISNYETNASLGRTRKGDWYEELVYVLNYNYSLTKNLRFTLDYNLDATGYNEITDLSTVLNHFKLGLHDALSKYLIVGGGYDFSYFYYPNDENATFAFHKGFVYLKNKWTKNTYQELQFQFGMKQYTDGNAIAHSTITYQDVERQDERQVIEYIWGTKLTKQLSLRLKTKYTINDSNAYYQDYHDYESLEFAPLLTYAINKKWILDGRVSVTGKEYQRREISGGTQDIQSDDLYVAGLGVRYILNKHNTISLNYSYTENASNDESKEYSSSLVSGGWRYNF